MAIAKPARWWLALAAVVLLAAGGIFAWKSRVELPGHHRYVIAVATLMEVPALDAVQAGLKDQLATEGFVDGKNVQYIWKNANGQIQLTSTIANELEAAKPDVIVPITTPMAQAVVKVATVPVVFASVTDPVGAKVVKTLSGEPSITGASDAWPFEAQMKLIREITPRVKRLGFLFNPGEAASAYGIAQVHKFAGPLGFTIVEAPVNSTNDMYAAARSLVGRVDALYLSSDNTVISGMAGALKVAIENHIPYYVGDSGTVEKGGMATVSVGYYQHGRHVGHLVAETLRGKRNLPVVVEDGTEVSVNTKSAELMGVTIPQAVLKRATHIYSTIKN